MLINGSYGSVMQNFVLLSAKYRFFLLSYLTIYRVFIEKCGSQPINLTAVLIICGYWNVKRGMQSTDEIPGYSMVIFHFKGSKTNLYIALRLILCISIMSITAAC